MPDRCTHEGLIDEAVRPASLDACEDCVRTGDSWIHLRVCLVCGYVGCCDESKNRHARRHFHATGHPVIQSYEVGENWRYCFIDDRDLAPGRALR